MDGGDVASEVTTDELAPPEGFHHLEEFLAIRELVGFQGPPGLKGPADLDELWGLMASSGGNFPVESWSQRNPS